MFYMPASAIASMLGGIVGTLGNLFGGSSSAAKSAQEAEKNRQFQAYEASINRDFNADEAQKNRDFQMAMYNSTNQYNDPSSVMKRLDAAGINPALAYSGGQLGTASMQGGSQASSSASPSGAMADYSGLQRMFDPLTMSQVHLNEAQARKLNSDADLTDKNVDWIDRLNNQLLTDSNFDNNLKDSIARLNDAQRSQVNSIIDNTVADTEYKRMVTQLTSTQISLNKIDGLLKEKTFDSVVRQMAAQASISTDEAKYQAGMLLSIIANNQANTEYTKELTYTQKLISEKTGYEGQLLFNQLDRSNIDMAIFKDSLYLYKSYQKKAYENTWMQHHFYNPLMQKSMGKISFYDADPTIRSFGAASSFCSSIVSCSGTLFRYLEPAAPDAPNKVDR